MADSPISQSVVGAYSAGSSIPVCTTEGRKKKKFDKLQKNLNSNKLYDVHIWPEWSGCCMSGSVLSGLQQYCSLAAVTSGPAHVILSKASRAAASLFSLPYPADLQSGWLYLRIRNMGLKRWQYCE